MVKIEIYEDTAEGLARQARDQGMSVPDYLRTLVPSNGATQCASWDDLERELLELRSAGASLPDDFSRADIYNDHD